MADYKEIALKENKGRMLIGEKYFVYVIYRKEWSFIAIKLTIWSLREKSYI